jgi:hypothetical protein
MSPIPTEELSVRIHDLVERFDDLRTELGGFRVEVTERLGAINGSLKSLEVRLDHSVAVAKWTIGILAPIIIALVGAGFWLTWHAAKLDSRVERVESRLDNALLRRGEPKVGG